jgi:hypothetical protein
MCLSQATDGYRVWDQTVEATKHKPKSRKESASEYILLILSCLRDLDISKRHYSVTLNMSGSLQFVIKEKLGSMMALLLKLDMNENFDAATMIRGMFQGVCDQAVQSNQALLDATKEIQVNREANDKLSQSIMSFAKDKEDFQNDFFKKMCIVMNTKKREIRRLQSEVSELEDEISGLKAKLASVSKSKSKPKTTTKSKVKKLQVKSSNNDDEDCSEDEVDHNYDIESDEDQDTSGNQSLFGRLSLKYMYSGHIIIILGSDLSDGDNSETTPASSQNTASSRSASKRQPPSFVKQPSKGLKKRKVVTSSSSQMSSQLISQVLAPASGSTETTSSDLTRILSESSQVNLSQVHCQVMLHVRVCFLTFHVPLCDYYV